jgi:hemolysin activation/secretion protein
MGGEGRVRGFDGERAAMNNRGKNVKVKIAYYIAESKLKGRRPLVFGISF